MRVVVAWELGRGFGHRGPVAVMAQLCSRFADVTVLVQNQESSVAWFEDLGLTVEVLPPVAAPAASFPLSINYSANLLRNGYGHQPTVATRVEAWRSALHQIRPALVIADHAPAALLASRASNAVRAVIGTGFTLPPLAEPMPGLQPWFERSPADLAVMDERLLELLNSALPADLPPLPSVSSLFDGTLRALYVEAECDHYDGRSDERFLGTLSPPDQFGPEPDGQPPEVFVYLSRHSRFVSGVLDALIRLGWRAWVYVPGGVSNDGTWPDSPCLHYLQEPIDLAGVRRCHLAITHGGTQTTSLFLRMNVPVLICPDDLEKAVFGARLVQRRLAHSLNYFAPVPADVSSRLIAARDDEATGAARAAFAQSCARSDAAAAAETFVELLRGRAEDLEVRW